MRSCYEKRRKVKFLCGSNMMCKIVKFEYRGKFIRINKSLHFIILHVQSILYFKLKYNKIFVKYMFPIHMNNRIKIIIYSINIYKIFFIFIFFLNWSIIYWWLQYRIYLWFVKKIIIDKKWTFSCKNIKKSIEKAMSI